MLDNTIRVVLGESVPFTLVVHDWGAVVGIGYQNKRPKRVSKMVILDVGIKKHMPAYDTIVILLYQWWFAASYIVSQIFGNAIGNFVFYGYAALVTAIPLLAVAPNSKKQFARPRKELSVHLTYVYYQFWKSFFSGNNVSAKLRFPSCPILYMVKCSFCFVIFKSHIFLFCSLEQPKIFSFTMRSFCRKFARRINVKVMR
jgi:pimeloyl-ACP methyl ester carboxylesterase